MNELLSENYQEKFFTNTYFRGVAVEMIMQIMWQWQEKFCLQYDSDKIDNPKNTIAMKLIIRIIW